jgi:general nucleoside transport system ATP-binding protein
MVGRNVQLRVSKEPAKPGETMLSVADLTVRGDDGRTWVDGLSFDVRAGEILGIAGVQGNGQTELCEALMGLRPAASGAVALNGRDLTRAAPRDRLRAGIAYVPEDRTEDGLVGSFSVAENLVLDMYDQKPFASGVNLKLPEIARNAVERITEFDVRTGSAATAAGTLSGGNQQKVILARELGREHKVLIASQPTRGLDVGSIEFVHRRIVQQRDHGVAVIIVSSELDEIYALADRIAVMYEGKITGFRDPDVPAAELGRLMAGGADTAPMFGGTVTDADVAEVAPVPGAANVLGAGAAADAAGAAPAPPHAPETPGTPTAQEAPVPDDPGGPAPPEHDDTPGTTAAQEEA